jgi:UDP-N-acetylglucosamine 1-carboxyvinyltransferase
MQVFEITGGNPLAGKIEVRGSKNATTPILAATLLAKTSSTIHNVPRIEDVFRILEIIESLGATVEWVGERSVKITPTVLNLEHFRQDLVKKMRSSILLLGALSVRFEEFTLGHPGGCILGARSVDTHMDALQKLGIEINRTKDGYRLKTQGKKSKKVVLQECSVTATENALMIAAALPGTTEIHFAAAEPHVQDLCAFLEKMGATIEGVGTHMLTVTGQENLSGAEHTIIPDANEAATFLVLGVATKSPLEVVGARVEHLEVVLEKLRQFGAEFLVSKESITVLPTATLTAVQKVETSVYPGLPTDTQPLFGVLAAVSSGKTLIHDPMFESRFNYVPELQKMGTTAKILNPHQVEITGPTRLRGTAIKSYDLRAGVSLIIAALCATGKTTIEEIYQVDRGYERIEERLQKIGADIQRVEKTL